MNTFKLIFLFPAIASMIYAGFIIRDAAFRAQKKPACNKAFFQAWLRYALVLGTPRRHKPFAILFCVSLLAIILLLANINYAKQ